MDIIPKVKENSTTKPEMEMVEQEKQEYKLLGSFLRTRGLKLFVYNPRTEEITEITPKRNSTLSLDGESIHGKAIKSRVHSDQSCDIDSRNIPFEALNMKNAIKRVNKYRFGTLKYLCNLTPTR